MKFQICKDTVVETISGAMNLREVIKSKVNSVGREDIDDAFYIGNIGDILNKIKKFKQQLPNVEPYYAVKCNNEPAVLEILSSNGLGFDCSSKVEIKTILNLGVSPNRIIYASPCKQPSHLRYAAANNVSMMTFDNEQELYKIKSLFPDAECIVRIRVDDSKSLFPLGAKFGVEHGETKPLLEAAKRLSLNIIGVSFHVGSNCHDPAAFYKAVEAARHVFDEGVSLGFNFNLLDIGGGFPGDETATTFEVSFEEIAGQLNRAFATFFPVSCNVRIIAEPGRFIVASAFAAVSNITAVRSITSKDAKEKSRQIKGFTYYVNDGVYGSFNCILAERRNLTAKSLEFSEGRKLYPSIVWGPTCDSLDRICKRTMLPKMEVGDWIYFQNMGAYTLAAASTFNGFMKPRVYYVVSETDTPAMLQLYQPMKENRGQDYINGGNEE